MVELLKAHVDPGSVLSGFVARHLRCGQVEDRGRNACSSSTLSKPEKQARLVRHETVSGSTSRFRTFPRGDPPQGRASRRLLPEQSFSNTRSTSRWSTFSTGERSSFVPCSLKRARQLLERGARSGSQEAPFYHPTGLRPKRAPSTTSSWLSDQKAGKRASAAITDAIQNDPETDEKKKAVFALSQLGKDQSVPQLIQWQRRMPIVRCARRRISGWGNRRMNVLWLILSRC